MASRGGLGADQDFEQIELTAAVAGSRGPHTLVADFTYQSTRSGVAPIQSAIRAGGFLNLSGYNEGELTGQHYSRLGTSYYYRLGRNQFLPLYVGASVEVGNVWENRADIGLDDVRWAGSVFVGADTFIGPLYMAYGDAEGPADAFYLFLGSVF